ncbi:type I phosphomannose isomerase catalytic subunit [Agromyces fucosus]|uniref:type I phosphomannose isomerase catalytic subunit n=1 Tax=Agromyces fucosus TaxID=41985 RepID=UPI0014047F82|nr:type I phosphomannose isomerase catalytic subunit [Agromyces fucosus]
MGAVDGVSRVLGHPPTGERQAELWLGAHPSGPSRAVTDATGGPDAAGLSDVQAHAWADLAEWEQASGRSLPFLLKILCAASPLSIQAHPDPRTKLCGRASVLAEPYGRMSTLSASRESMSR